LLTCMWAKGVRVASKVNLELFESIWFHIGSVVQNWMFPAVIFCARKQVCPGAIMLQSEPIVHLV
jgi:hypothetical protein